MKVRRRVRTVLLRWSVVVVLSAGIAIAVHVALPWIWEYERGLRRPSAVAPIWIRAAVWFLVAAAVYWLTGFFRIRMRHLRIAYLLPPWWLAVPLGAILAVILHILIPALRLSPEVVSALWPWRVGMAAFAVAIGLGARTWTSETQASTLDTSEPLAQVGERRKWADIRKWARSEETSGVDLLGHRPLAARLARTLLEEGWLHRRATALVGLLGSGKSTVLRWVAWKLSEGTDPEIWHCWVSCWGLEDSRYLAAHVLRKIVEEVDEHVDAAALRGVPDAYLKLLGATRLNPLEALFARSSERDVLSVLQQIPPILEVAKARIVVFIEDGDRAAAKDFDPGHLERLIWSLRDVDRIACVLAVDRNRVSFDLGKLCEHVELMPPLPAEAVREVLWATREHCLKDFTFVRPARPGLEADPIDLAPDDEDGLKRLVRRGFDKTGSDSIADLIATPRALKHVVRRVERVWQQLCGEVDLDDLIVVALLKECCPEAFTFLLVNYEQARRRPDDFNKRPEVVKKEWEALVAGNRDVAKASLVVNILGFEQLRSKNATHRDSAQGAHVESPTDYFRRILAEEVDEGDVHDQTVLGDMDLWVGGKPDPMVESLLGRSRRDERYSNIWKHFAWRIPVDRMPGLLDQLFEPVLRRLREEGIWDPPLGFAACSEYVRSVGGLAAAGADRVQRFAVSILPESVAAAVDILKYWSDGPDPTREAAKRIRLALVGAAQEQLARPSELLHALRADETGTGLQKLAGLETPEAMRWLVAPMLSALRESPAAMTKQVAHLVGDVTVGSDPRTGRTAERYAIRRELVEQLSGEQLDDLLSLLAASDPDGDWMCIEAKAKAAQWLKERRIGT